LVALSGFALAQPADVQEPASAEEIPCQVDERLSLWLSLEAADRTIAALERERRELSKQLAELEPLIDVLRAAASGRVEGMNVRELTVLSEARGRGEAVVYDEYNRREERLNDVEKTLRRRVRQQAAVEARLDEILGLER
jgi:hypothetical protein